ncbi:MAG TPA: hypothetical protein VF411_15620 [Bacteroidia bacterium]
MTRIGGVIHKRVIATLKFSTVIPNLIIYVRGIVLKCTGNASLPATFPVGTTSLADCILHVNDLETKEAAAQTHASGAADARDIAHEVCKKDMRSIRAMAQQLADNNLANNVVIITSCGLGIKAPGVKKPRVFGVKNTLVSGTIKLTCKANKLSRGSHDWFYTADLVNFTNKQPIPPTSKAGTTFAGMHPLVKYAFFHTAIAPGEVNLEEGPIFLSVI